MMYVAARLVYHDRRSVVLMPKDANGGLRIEMQKTISGREMSKQMVVRHIARLNDERFLRWGTDRHNALRNYYVKCEQEGAR